MPNQIYAEASNKWWEHQEGLYYLKIQNDYIKFIDYLVNAISNGKYLYYQLSYIPKDKMDNEDFLNRLDKKMDNKYQAYLNKSERLKLRRKEKARHLYTRYQNIVVVLRTEGETDVAPGEKWKDIRKHKIELKLGKYTTYMIGVGPSKKKKNDKSLDFIVSVTLSPDTVNYIKLSCIDCIRYQKDIRRLVYEWNKINGFNGWSGVNKQKLQLKEYLVKEVRRSFSIKQEKAEKLFRVNTFKAKAEKDRLKEVFEDVDLTALIAEITQDSVNATDLPVADTKVTGPKP